MPPAITCPVKCRPHHRVFSSPQPAPAAASKLRFSSRRCRSPPSLSLSRAADRPPCRRSRRARRGDGGSSAALLAGTRLRHAAFRDELVWKAFSEAAHRGQDTFEFDDAWGLEYGFVSEQFGAGVADLVMEVSNLSRASKLARKNSAASRTDEADRLRAVFLATVDARAALIKLADRLHNMETLNYLPKVKQQSFAKETLEIFAPLANQLGILTWKEQLENLCFKYQYPDEYEELSTNHLELYNRDMIAAATRRLEQVLEVRGLSFYTVYGRHKSLYSIYSKMRRKKLAMDEIYDIHGVRVILETKFDCFTALEIVHHLWPRIPGRFKDYIKSPKTNGYQSLHTVVLPEETLPLEIQIRTRDMHLHAEFGIAAHWRYKEGVQKSEMLSVCS